MIKGLILAALPVLAETLGFRSAALIAGLLFASWWLTLAFFALTKPLFPGPLLKIAVLLWLMTLAQMSWTLWHLNPLWIVSLYLLLHEEIKTGEFEPSVFSITTVVQSLGFFLLLIVLGGIQELLGRKLGMGFFHINMWLFLILIFGFLLAEEKAERKTPSRARQVLGPVAVECFHLLWQVSLLLAFYLFAIELWMRAGHEKEVMILVLFPLAYALGLLQKQSRFFFLCVFSLAFFVTQFEMDYSILMRICFALKLVIGIFLFQFLLLGLREKMLLFPIPKPLEGFPISLITAFLLGLVLAFVA